MNGLNPNVRMTRHCLSRFVERHEKEVEIRYRNEAGRIPQDIMKELIKSKCWRDANSLYMVYNQLRVYICKLLGDQLIILTEYPYTKKIKHRLNSMSRVENPLEAGASIVCS